MPYPFKLPTTSLVALQDFFDSGSNPSLPSAATTSRAVVRNALKKHKRLRSVSQTPHLPDVLIALDHYIPLLTAIESGLTGVTISGEQVHITLKEELQVQWRAVLLAGVPGREAPRITFRGLTHELSFTLSTLASTNYLIARNNLHTLYDASTPTTEQRVTAISTAMKHFLEANSIYAYLSERTGQLATPSLAPDVAPSTFAALASLALAEATLLAVFKDDPYPATVVQERNKYDKEWMYKAPDMTSVRASLFARLCIAAADHARQAAGMIAYTSKVVDSLPKYINNLNGAAKAKACRFLAIDAELAGNTGEAIAWLQAAQAELGLVKASSDRGTESKAFGKLKRDWAEKREDRRTEKGQDWGSDAGQIEEGRVVEMLLAKWSKMNSIMNVQTIPHYETLRAKLPSGREFHRPKAWVVPTLDSNTLSRMRAPPPSSAVARHVDEDDSDDEDRLTSAPAGAFPGTESNYSNASTYY